MSDLLALEPDAVQAERLRTTVADRVAIPLRIVADPEAAIAEINQLAPAILLVGRSVPRGRRDAVVAHAKKAAGPGLIVLEIPSFRAEEAPERRFLKFGFKKPTPAPGDGLDPLAFAEQVSTALAKRIESRKRTKASEPPASQPRAAAGSAPTTDVEKKSQEKTKAATVDALGVPSSEPPPSTIDLEMLRREADVRLMAEIERVRAEAADQYQREVAALEREQAVLREAAVAQAVADAEADAQALLRAELERARAEGDEAVAAERARVRAQAEARIEEATTEALREEVARVTAAHAFALEEAVALARDEETRRHASELERVRQEADARIAAAVLEAQKTAAAAADQTLDELAALAREEALAHAERDLGTVRAEAEALRRQHEDALRATAGSRDDVRGLEAQLARAREEAAGDAAELARLRADSESRLAAEQQVAARTLADMRRTLDAAQSTIDALQEEARAADEARRHAHDLEVQLAQARRDADAGASEIARLRAESDARLTTEQARTGEALATLQRALDVAESDVASLRKELLCASVGPTDEARTLEAQLANAREEAAGDAAEMARLRGEFEARLAEEQERATSELAVAHESLLALQTEVAAREEQTARLAAAVSEAHADAQRNLTERVAEVLARAQQEATARLEAEVARVREEERALAQTAVAQIRHEAEAALEDAVAHARDEEIRRAAAAVAAAQQEALGLIDSELQRVREEEGARAKALLAEARQEAHARLTAAVSRLRDEETGRAEAALAEQAREAGLLLDTEIARIQREASARAEVALADARRAAGEARACALEEARLANEATVRRLAEEATLAQRELTATLQGEIDRARVEADAFRAEVNRAHQQINELRMAEPGHAEAPAGGAPDEAIRAEVAHLRLEVEQTRTALSQAEERHQQALLAAELTATAARTRLESDAEARVLSELTRAQHEATSLRAALQAAERERETVQRAAAQALQEELARVRAEADAAGTANLSRAREELARALEAQHVAEQIAKESEQQAKADLERVRGQAAREARAAAEDMAATTLKIEVKRAKAETESRLGELISRLRADGDRVRRELDDVRLELEKARHQYATSAAERGRPSDWVPERFGASRREPGGLLHRHKRLVLAGAALAVFAGIVALGLHRVALRSISSLTTNREEPAEIATTEVAPPPLVARPRRAPARPTPVATTLTAPAEAPAGQGFINVFSRIPLELFLGDRRLGTSEDQQLLLPAGRHQLRIVNTRFHFQGMLPVDVRQGALTSHTVALPSAQVRITAPDGAEIWVEGQHMGSAPLSAIEVPIGTREIVARHSELGERRQSVEVRQGEIADVSLEMTIQDPVGADAAGLPDIMPAGLPPVIAQ